MEENEDLKAQFNAMQNWRSQEIQKLTIELYEMKSENLKLNHDLNNQIFEMRSMRNAKNEQERKTRELKEIIEDLKKIQEENHNLKKSLETSFQIMNYAFVQVLTIKRKLHDAKELQGFANECLMNMNLEITSLKDINDQLKLYVTHYENLHEKSEGLNQRTDVKQNAVINILSIISELKHSVESKNSCFPFFRNRTEQKKNILDNLEHFLSNKLLQIDIDRTY